MDLPDIASAFAAHIASHYDGGIVTGWVAIVEHCDETGAFSVLTLHDDASPPWKLAGLLTAVEDFYAEEEDD